MFIHVVKAGENIYSIAEIYKISPQKIILDNELTNPSRLVIGQALVIMSDTALHTVSKGESLYNISKSYGVTVQSILNSNPTIKNNAVYPGQVITISYTKPNFGTITVLGYIYPFIRPDVYRKTLPYLTYTAIFSYGITPQGGLINLDDTDVIATAIEYGVAPLMMLTTMTADGKFNTENISIVINNENLQNTLIENILRKIQEKNYSGLDIDIEFIPAEDADNFVEFISKITKRLNAFGYYVSVALAPKSAATKQGLLYAGHDYKGIGQAANEVLLMTYGWGYSLGPPLPIAPLNKVNEVVSYAITQIPKNKINLGIPNYGYDWILPYEKGTKATIVSNLEAINIAALHGAIIEYDKIAQSPFFNYYDDKARKHIVWFEDARSIEAKLKLLHSYNLNGVGYWNVMKFFPQNWLVLKSYFNTKKVL